MIYVVDASIAVKWFAPDGDATDRVAESVLHQLVRQPRGFVVPELFFHELLSVLCRRLGQARDVSAAMDRTVRLGIRRVRLDERLTRRAARLAFDQRITGYDACYLALALEFGGTWLTLDARAHARVAALGASSVPE